MRLQPKGASRCGRIDACLLPPRGFIATAMDLAMVTAAERNREFIADLAAKRRWLQKSQVMRVGRAATANQAREFRNRFDMVSVPNPTRCWQGEYAFINVGLAPSFATPSTDWWLGIVCRRFARSLS